MFRSETKQRNSDEPGKHKLGSTTKIIRDFGFLAQKIVSLPVLDETRQTQMVVVLAVVELWAELRSASGREEGKEE